MNTVKSILQYLIVFILISPLSAQNLTIWTQSESDSLRMGVTNEVAFKASGYENVTALQLYFKIDTTQFQVGEKIALNDKISDDADIFYHRPSQTLILLYYSTKNNGESIGDSTSLFTIGLLPKDSTACFSTSVSTIDQYDEIIVEQEGEKFIPVEFINNDICVSREREKLARPQEPDFKVINYISPNGDGKNDFLEFRGLEKYTTRNLTVFSTWGNKVYESSAYENNWDGYYQNALVPEGNYYYILEYGQDTTQSVSSMLTIHQ